MQTILDNWMNDIPSQFLGKHNIEVLMTAFAKQLEEVNQVLSDVNSLLEIDTATGKGLDMIGNILSYTRFDATADSGGDETSLMDDETYRNYLRLQLLRNTSECTYYDLIEGIKILWNVDTVYYLEEEDEPATFYIYIPGIKEGGSVNRGNVPLLIKSAGVKAYIVFNKWSVLTDRTWGSLSETRWSMI